MRIKAWLVSLKNTWLVHLLLPIAFIILMVLFHPFRETFQVDPDEGINLIKATLVMEGHQITGDIDSDQPPLLSNLLALIFQWTGQSVNVARFVILLFSAVLLGAAGMASQIAWDRSTSILVYVMLILLPDFLDLSASVMIGQPSIALAMVALLCLFLWHRNRQWSWLVLAGLFMSLSLFMKIFTAILIPVFGIGLLAGEWTNQRGTLKKQAGERWITLLKPALIFSASLFGFIAVLVIALVDLENVMSLILPHLEYRNLTMVTRSITAYLKTSWLVISLGVIGLGYSIAQRKWLALYPAAWAIIAYISLVNHNPIWWHHHVLVTIPSALLASFGAVNIVRDFWRSNTPSSRWQTALVFCGLLIIGALMSWHTSIVLDQLGNRSPSIRGYGLDPDSGDMLVLKRMLANADEGDLVVTDMPIFVVRAKMRVPVELAWVSDKRIRTGLLTKQDFIDAIEREEPALVLIARYPMDTVRSYLEANPDYEEVVSTKIFTGNKATLYRRVVDENTDF
jgi:4-amino-4-deoxy-L-arabinose transferase-like glycosyltransferase